MTHSVQGTRVVLYADRVLTPSEEIRDAAILIEDGKIAEIGTAGRVARPAGAVVQRVEAGTVCPGFIDTHTHGVRGIGFASASPDGLRAAARFLLTAGVTSFLPTIASAPPGDTLQAIGRLRDAMRGGTGGATILGIHLEGPFLSPERPGAMRHLRRPDRDELCRMLAAGEGSVRLMTVAPEVEGASALIEDLQAHGVSISLGHTNATYTETRQAIRRGVTGATHTFNAMSGLHHREPGAAGAVMESDSVHAEVIGDMVHVHPVMLSFLLHIKGLDRVHLVTDAVEAAGLEDGIHTIDGRAVVVRGGECRLPDGTLAGSTSLMNRDVRLCREALGLDLPEAIRLATSSPASSLECARGKGRLRPGSDADLIVINDEVDVLAAMVAGEWRYGEGLIREGVVRGGEPRG